jgi:heme-degrading monooxygenase HmoA
MRPSPETCTTGGVAMFARVTTYEGPADRPDADEDTQAGFVSRVLQMDGCEGVLGLADRSNGRVLTITLWDTEAALRASEEAANQVRTDAAEAGGTTIADVERFEVMSLQMRQTTSA